MQERMEMDRISNRDRELAEYREQIGQLQKEIMAYRKRVNVDQLEREKEFQKEFEEREQLFSKREKQLTLRQLEFEQHLVHRQSEVEQLRQHLHVEIADRESLLNKARIDLDREKERYNEESRKNIEHTLTLPLKNGLLS